MNDTPTGTMITLAKFGKTYGLKGWLRLYSFTDPQNNVFNYTPWLIKKNDTWQACVLNDYRQYQQDWLIRINDCQTCDDASQYVNALVGIEKVKLPTCDEDEIYWHDLIGLDVIDQHQKRLGIIAELFETGANPVLVIRDNHQKEQLVPYVDHVIISVDLSKRTVCIDWEF